MVEADRPAGVASQVMSGTPESEPAWDPPLAQQPKQAVAVFADERRAAKVVNALVDIGFDRRRIRVGDPDDRRSALRGEMREEVDHTVAGPAGAMPREETVGATVATGVGIAIGVAIGLLLSLIPFGLAWWVRAVILVGIGAGCGSTIGFIAGGGFLARGPAEPAAAARGVTVAIDPATNEAISLLRDAAPIRLDLLTEGGETLGTVTTETAGQSTPSRVAHRAEERVHDDPTSQEAWASGEVPRETREHGTTDTEKRTDHGEP